jgi:alkylated DNA repair dioxygenase AlkB
VISNGHVQGISSHFEDTSSFGDNIMTISLISPVFMTLKRPRENTNQCQDILEETKVLLEPRSCLIMSGECRYKWRHGISKTKYLHMPDGSIVHRDASYRRLSLTIRRVLDGRRRALEDTDKWL